MVQSFLAIALVVVVLSSLMLGTRRESLEVTQVKIVELAETAQIMKEDRDGYITRMTPADLWARGAASKEAYIARETKKLRPVSAELRNETLLLVARAREDAQHLEFEAWGIDRGLFLAMPWRVALIHSETYEGGMPHTRGETIFFPVSLVKKGDTDAVRTLLHEQVHVYQKKYVKEVESFLWERGFRKSHRREGGGPLVRSNPDTDGWTWMDPQGRAMQVEYASERPRGLGDTRPGQSVKREHPWEWMAYGIVA